MGELLQIYLRPEKHSEMKSVDYAQAIEGLGLSGDHFCKKNGKRQVTILAKEAWDDVCEELGDTPDPKLRRSNLLVRGLDLKGSTGRILKIGYVLILIEGETTPCRLMDDTKEGLKKALTSEWRGGVYGSVISGGPINKADRAVWSSGL